MIAGVNHVTLCVADLDRALAFYVELLGCRPKARWRRGVYLEAGALWLCLELAEHPVPAKDDSHLAFTALDYAALAARLQAAKTPTWKENRSEGASLYILDPDGHKLEIHEGDLASRLASCRAKPYADMTFYE